MLAWYGAGEARTTEILTSVLPHCLGQKPIMLEAFLANQGVARGRRRLVVFAEQGVSEFVVPLLACRRGEKWGGWVNEVSQETRTSVIFRRTREAIKGGIRYGRRTKRARSRERRPPVSGRIGCSRSLRERGVESLSEARGRLRRIHRRRLVVLG